MTLNVKVCLIAAMSNDHVIGYKGEIPWHSPSDLRYFKAATLGKPVIMGRKTYESLPGKRPLPQRTNLVVTSNATLKAPGFQFVPTLEEAIKVASQVYSTAEAEKEVMVIGGETLYRQALPLADRILLTVIDVEVKGDTYFPYIPRSKWTRDSCQKLPTTPEEPDCTVTVWRRRALE